jgi:multidrug efflux system membrane fusion protein
MTSTQHPAGRLLPPGQRGATLATVLVSLAVLAAAAGGGWYWYSQKAAADDAAKGAPDVSTKGAKGGSGKGGAGKGGFDPNRATPVAAVPARKGDISVTLSGLGTVTPLRTVTVRSRADGELTRVLFNEGQLVKAGELLAEIDPRAYLVQLAQAEGQLARDQALLANARIDLERYRTLFAQDSIAKQQVDTQDALVRQYEGTVRTDQAQVDNARLLLSYTRVTAPVAGRAGLRQLDQGNMVRAGDANGLVTITQLQPISVVFTIPQDALPAVLKRMQARQKLVVEAWDRELKNRLAAGVLASTDNQIDTATGTIKLRAQFANDDSVLFPNQFVNVKLKVDTLSDATLVPSAAVQRGTQGPFAFVVREDRTATLRRLKLGATDSDTVQIEDGIQPGELVVTEGTERLREGARVEMPERAARGGDKGGEKGSRRRGGDGAGTGSGANVGGAARSDAAPADAKGGERSPNSADAAKDGERPSRKGGGGGDGAAGPDGQRRWMKKDGS